MELQTAIEILEYHQEWRLGRRDKMIHEPKILTEALDIILKEVKLHQPTVISAVCNCQEHDGVSQGFGKPMICSNCLKDL